MNIQEKHNERRERQKRFNDELKYMLLYVGFAGAIISAIAYLIITLVLITGFKSQLQLQQQLYFSIFSSAIGLVISFLLRSQGRAFAEKEEHSIQVNQEYEKLLNKTSKAKKNKSFTNYMLKRTFWDIVGKGISITGSMFGLIYMFSQGNADWSLMGLALSNILMFTSFGLISLSKAYDYYLDKHIPYLQELIDRMKEKSHDSTRNQGIDTQHEECNN